MHKLAEKQCRRGKYTISNLVCQRNSNQMRLLQSAMHKHKQYFSFVLVLLIVGLASSQEPNESNANIDPVQDAGCEDATDTLLTRLRAIRIEEAVFLDRAIALNEEVGVDGNIQDVIGTIFQWLDQFLSFAYHQLNSRYLYLFKNIVFHVSRISLKTL